HAYDGIQEYDNPRPGWWKWIFVATILFSAVYYFVAVVSGGKLGAVWAYEKEQAAEQAKFNARPLADDAASLIAYTRDDTVKSAGAALFAANCALCHKPDGGGMVGPNLTDDAYINIKAIDDIPKLIRSGAKNGAMPSFSRLPPNDIVRLAVHVASLRGKNVPGGKPPEGTVIASWGAVPTTGPATAPAPAPSTSPAK
ncbi:MAG TPA: cbb3-type cytochrome c oxidase N-terminal domain-containing protein, partial [Humisphaera sp.]